MKPVKEKISVEANDKPTLKSRLIALDLWLRNPYVLHVLMASFLVIHPLIVLDDLTNINSTVLIVLASILSFVLGFGKETFDKFVKKGPFELGKAIITMLGGLFSVLIYFIFKTL